MLNTLPYTAVKHSAGTQLKPSNWLLIDQQRINAFAETTGDHQYIHTDPERAAQTELGGTIAHGLLSLALLPTLAGDSMLVPEGMTMGINYGFNKVRFLNVVRPGDEVRAEATVTHVEEKSPGRLLVALNLQLAIKGEDKPALVCEWLNLFVCAAAE